MFYSENQSITVPGTGICSEQNSFHFSPGMVEGIYAGLILKDLAPKKKSSMVNLNSILIKDAEKVCDE